MPHFRLKNFSAVCDKKGTIKYIQEKEKVYGGGGGEVKGGLLGPPLPLHASQETKGTSIRSALDPPYEPPFWC